MYLLRNRCFVFICLISMGVQLVAPSAGLCEENPKEKTISILVNKDVVKGSHNVQFLDQLATNGIPAVYGEIMGAVVKSGSKNFVNEAWKGGEVATQLATQKFVRDRLSKIVSAIGNLTAALDVGGKYYSEQYTEAGISASLTLLSKVAGSAVDKGVFKVVGITSTAPFTAAIVAFTIWRESKKAFDAATASRELESLYGSVEIMVRDRSRKTLGQGDPFPVTSENIELVWKRVLNNPSFRALFKVYVTDQLKKTDFPEPGYFDTVGAYISSPFSSKSASDTLEDQSKAELQKEYSRLKSYIGGLVSWLNRAAKVREQQAVARQELQKLADRIKQASGGSMEQAIKKMDRAIIMLRVVDSYLKDLMEEIEKAAKAKDCMELQLHQRLIAGYVKDVIAWIPAKGPFAERRNAAFTKLKEAYSKAEVALKNLKKEIREKLDKPEAPETSDEIVEDLPEVDAVGMYKKEFGKILKPFDWGGLGDVSAIKDNYLKMFDTGQFRHPLDTPRVALPEGRKPVAMEIENAWLNESYQSSAGNSGETPAAEDTIPGYDKYLSKKIAEVKTPTEIVSLNGTVSTKGAEISKLWKKGNNLYWSRDEAFEAIKGLTKEQQAANRVQGKAMMETSKNMGKALQPSRDRLNGLNIAWEQAQQMAKESVGHIILLAELKRDETTAWMSQTRAFYENELYPLFERYHNLNARLNSFMAPYKNYKNAVLEEAIDSLEATVNDNSYVGLQGAKIASSPNLFSGAAQGIAKLTGQLHSGEEKLKAAARLIDAEMQTLDSMEYLAKQWDDFISEASQAVWEINKYIVPSFMDDDNYSEMQSFFGNMDSYVSEYREQLEKIEKKCFEYMENRQNDSGWLQRASNNLNKFRETASQAGMLGFTYNKLTVGGGRVSNAAGGLKTTSVPYYHCLTANERDLLLTSLNNLINSSNLGAFLTSVAPWLDKEVEGYLAELASLTVAQEDNFILDRGPIVFKSNLSEATGIVNSLSPGSESFDENVDRIRKLVRLYPSESADIDFNIPLIAPFRNEYLALRAKLISLYYQHSEAMAEKQKAEYAKLAKQAMSKWPSLAGPLKDRINTGDDLIKKASDPKGLNKNDLQILRANIQTFVDNLRSGPWLDFQGAASLLGRVNKLKGEYIKDWSFIKSGLQRLLGQLVEAMSALDSRIKNYDDKSEVIKLFYDDFKKAYEEKNDSGLMNCLSDEWEAGDGTTLYDVEDYFRNMFTVFDDIRLDITNMKIEKVSAGTYRVFYNLLITGRIFSENIVHEEKSSVNEEVRVSGSGKVRITRTPEGRFWYVN